MIIYFSRNCKTYSAYGILPLWLNQARYIKVEIAMVIFSKPDSASTTMSDNL